jgi:hypothetical protein
MCSVSPVAFPAVFPNSFPNPNDNPEDSYSDVHDTISQAPELRTCCPKKDREGALPGELLKASEISYV